MLGVQLWGEKQLLAEAGAASPPGEPPRSPALQGEAELAYLTHEGLFISDALNELQQQVQDHTQKATTTSRGPQIQPEAAGGDSAPEAAETFTYVCEGAWSETHPEHPC